jgi:hypothetical protein
MTCAPFSVSSGPSFPSMPAGSIVWAKLEQNFKSTSSHPIMPGNIQIAAPSGVMPASVCTAFTELREYVQLQNLFWWKDVWVGRRG